ncbi:MAG TPA: cupin domain-containing protein, partial [Rhodothermales bacterium]|nr:cupin domain-containing protein [Rhodothermales bacterium]
MEKPVPLLGGLSPADFLAEYWQKKPLLVRGALPDFESPVSPEDLAGLACEPDVSARLILERGGDYPWQLRHGPFDEQDFADLAPTHWTLLVSEVDRWVPEVAALLDRFRFIPSWRIDDVMISYAPAEGGVGAHVDNYDVFLLQAKGQRRWQIGAGPVQEENLVPDIDIRMLRDFEPEEEWLLAPGDLLYLPPRIAHHGVAVGDCMTYSIGFRAPSYQDILTGFLSYLAEQVDPLARYSDPDLKPQLHPGEIGPSALGKVRALLQ